jgi:hypothetical protein
MRDGMIFRLSFGILACSLLSCTNEPMSVRHQTERPAAVAEEASADAPRLSFHITRSDLRPLSKTEIQNSLQDILLLPSPPELEGFAEQSSKSQIFRNSYDILNDSSSLAGLSRDITTLMESLDLRQVSDALVQCDALETETCRTRLLERMATHAWRRPLEPQEKDVLNLQSTALSKLQAAVQNEALAHTMSQIFFDPRFLFRVELGSGAVKATYALASWEKLAAISYDLRHRPPAFDEIMALAEFEKDPKRFAQLIDGMIDAPELATALANMISQWLMYYGLESMDIQGDPTWSREKAKAYLAGAQQFIGETLAQDGTLQALFTRPNPENDGYGLFSSKAFLTATSKNGQGSMILRGVRIIRNALCQPMGVPPGTLEAAAPKDLSPADPNYDIKLTLLHGSRPACAACHRQIDPAGLALHAFNGFGANSNALVDFSALGIPSQVRVGLGGQVDSIATGSAREFAESIAQSSTFARCFSRQALRYFLGRDLAEEEIKTADQLADRHLATQAGGKESLANFIRDIMNAESIYMRAR